MGLATDQRQLMLRQVPVVALVPGLSVNAGLEVATQRPASLAKMLLKTLELMLCVNKVTAQETVYRGELSNSIKPHLPRQEMLPINSMLPKIHLLLHGGRS